MCPGDTDAPAITKIAFSHKAKMTYNSLSHYMGLEHEQDSLVLSIVSKFCQVGFEITLIHKKWKHFTKGNNS